VYDDFSAFGCTRQGIRIEHIRLAAFAAQALKQLLSFIASREAKHCVAATDELLNKRAPQHTRRARDKNLHTSLLLSSEDLKLPKRIQTGMDRDCQDKSKAGQSDLRFQSSDIKLHAFFLFFILTISVHPC
jgi:hypothetical protein